MTRSTERRSAQRQSEGRQFWLWVTGPDYYLDDGGEDRADLDPENYEDSDGWWTCDRATRRGDLILLWRARIRRDIGYLIRAESDAFSLRDDPDALPEWLWGCRYRPLYRFRDPCTIAELREHPVLSGWAPLRAKFRQRAFRIAPADWRTLNRFLGEREPAYRPFLTRLTAGCA